MSDEGFSQNEPCGFLRRYGRGSEGPGQEKIAFKMPRASNRATPLQDMSEAHSWASVTTAGKALVQGTITVGQEAY
jgi:hypothetical protein